MPLQRGWSEKDSKDNAEANAIHAAASGQQYFVKFIQASFSANPTAPVLLQILDGSTVIWEGYVADANGIALNVFLPGTKGNSMTAKLAASGTGGRVGKVNIQGEGF